MRTSIALLLAAGLVLSNCGGWRDSRINPGNWFGNSRSAEVVASSDAEEVNPLIPSKARQGLFDRPEAEDKSVLIASITALTVEQTPSGAIIYATGLAERQGAFNLFLKRDENTDEKTISFSFRADYPERPTAVGSELTRTVRAAASLSHQDLAGVKLIRVTGANNAHETRRR